MSKVFEVGKKVVVGSKENNEPCFFPKSTDTRTVGTMGPSEAELVSPKVRRWRQHSTVSSEGRDRGE
jgi:hypothetical protein